MKQIFLKHFFPYLMLLSLLVNFSCTDIWKEHYDVESFDLADNSISEIVQDDSQLSIFYNMLLITGYDKILNSSQAFTVWAPTNNALAEIDTTDKALVLNIVENHIARSRYTTSGIETESVSMINGKNIFFNRKESGFGFGNNTILNPNLTASNGLVHIIDGYAPYLNNLWEYISKTDKLDSLEAYLYGEVQNIFDPENNKEIGVDSNGTAIYDSSNFIITNPVLDKIGNIETEDSVYTALFPDNDAWTEAYGRIEGYFNFPQNGGGTIRQRSMTQYTLVKDMLFRDWLAQPATLDSLVSTTGSVFQNPGAIFLSSEGEYLSNGIAHVTSQMPFADTASWFKEIKVEAEETDGRTYSNSSIFSRSGFGSGMNVSNNRYILVDPLSASPSVKFSIPNTLSAKYNIYCVFVPAKIVNPSDYTPTKATFKLTYIKRSSGSVFTDTFTPANNITSSTGLTKMLVTQFDFDFANIIDEDYEQVSVELEVINDVSSVEESSGEFSRTMRIDCIILEPVTE